MRLRPYPALVLALVALSACSDTVAPTDAIRTLSPRGPSAVVLTADSKYVCCGLGVTGLLMTPSSVSLAPAATASVTATLKTNYGWTLDPAEKGRLVVWESSDTTIAKVVSTGRASASITAVRGGTTTITAYVQSVSTKVPVTVTGTQTAPAPTQPPTPAASAVIA